MGGDGGDVGGFRCDAAELIASELLLVGRRIKSILYHPLPRRQT